MHKRGKSIEPAFRFVVAPGWEQGAYNGYGITFWSDENMLELNNGGGCATFKYTKAIELYSFKGWTVLWKFDLKVFKSFEIMHVDPWISLGTQMEVGEHSFFFLVLFQLPAWSWKSPSGPLTTVNLCLVVSAYWTWLPGQEWSQFLESLMSLWAQTPFHDLQANLSSSELEIIRRFCE